MRTASPARSEAARPRRTARSVAAVALRDARVIAHRNRNPGGPTPFPVAPCFRVEPIHEGIAKMATETRANYRLGTLYSLATALLLAMQAPFSALAAKSLSSPLFVCFTQVALLASVPLPDPARGKPPRLRRCAVRPWKYR